MQIDIRLIPFYEKPFVELFPGTAGMLHQVGRPELAERDISLYDLIDDVADIHEDPNVVENIRSRLGVHVERLVSLKARAREHLLARRLNELDQVLYLIEDAFEDLEEVLA